MLELVPLGHQNKAVRILGDIVGVVAQYQVGHVPSGGLTRHGIECLYRATLALEHVDDFQGRSLAQVVGIRLEGQSQDANGSVRDPAEGVPDLLDDSPAGISVCLLYTSD